MKPEKKRIGLLIPEIGRGGAERVVSILTRILSDEFEVFLIVYQSRKKVYQISSSVIDMQLPSRKGVIRSGITFIRRCHKMSSIIQKYRLDAVVSFLSSANMVNAFAKGSDLKKIISVRSYEYGVNVRLDLKGKLFDFIYYHLEKKVINRVDRVVTVSKMIQYKMSHMYPHAEKKLVTIYNPYELEQIKLQSQEVVADWDTYFAPEDFIFVTVGRLQQTKGLWHLIKIFNYITKENSHAKLLIIGDGPHKGKIVEAIQKFCLEGKVIMVGDQNNPFKYVAKSDIYLLTSIREGFPNALVEAMACGLPVVANDCLSGPREILRDKTDFVHDIVQAEYAEYGILTPRLKVDENWRGTTLDSEERVFFEAVKQLMSDVDMRELYCNQSKKRAMDFDCETCRKRYGSLF